MHTPAPSPPRSVTPVLQERRSASLGVFADGTRLGSWRVVRALGQGATGIVYEVEHCRLRTRRALKVLTWAHPMLQARLLTEGRAQAALLHPHIVTVLDMISIGDVPALLLELVDGVTLDAWIEDHRPGPVQAEQIFRSILDAVETAHEAGLVHRDLKPANVLMARVPGGVVPKVTDFGLAKDAHSDLGLTKTGMTMGTPGYMAPEQIRSPRDVDQRADIFALGCIFYQLLTGRQPHDGPDALTVMNAVTLGQVPRLDRACPEAPRRVVRAVQAAMAVDPDERPFSCAELRALLDGEHAGGPVHTSWSWQTWLGLAVVMAGIGTAGVAASLGIAALATRSSIVAPPDPPSAALPAQELPEDATIVIPEPWVPDDVDPTLIIPEPPVQEEAEAVQGPARYPASSASEPSTSGCSEGFIRLPWLARSPDPGPWPLKRDLELYEQPESEEPACVILDGSEVIVLGEVERIGGGRYVQVSLH